MNNLQDPQNAQINYMSDNVATDTGRHDATQRDDTRVMSRHDAVRRDSETLGIADMPPRDELYTWRIDELERAFRMAGITKNRRTLQRYLEKGMIEGAKLDSGAYVVNEKSAQDFIEDKVRQEALAAQTVREEHINTLHDEIARERKPSPDPVEHTPIEDTSNSENLEIEPKPITTEQNIEVRVENAGLKATVEQLELRVQEKDRQIEYLEGEVSEAHKERDRAFQDAHGYKALLANQNSSFMPLLEATSDAVRNLTSEKVTPSPTANLFEHADIQPGHKTEEE